MGHLVSKLSFLEKAFKGMVVNRALPSLLGGSLEITLTVTLTKKARQIVDA